MDIVHCSVLQKEVLYYLKPEGKNSLMIDATLGEGGHSELFLSRFNNLKVVAIETDAEILEAAKERLDPYSSRIRYYNAWFNNFFQEYPLGDERPDIILFDLGISLYHYEKGGRGFSFQRDETLDMRLNKDLEISAYDIVNNTQEKELADLIFEYGEEHYSRRIAKAIVYARKSSKIETTKMLENVIWKAVPVNYRRGKRHPGTKTFQALRIAVNGELVRLESVLQNAFNVLKPGGKMGVISFHSLEDRIVKLFIKKKMNICTSDLQEPIPYSKSTPIVKVLTKKPVKPDEEEIKVNPSSRSAKLRVLKKMTDEEL